MNTIQDLVNYLPRFGNHPALQGKEGREVITVTFQELFERVTAISRGLMELGLQKGDRIALFSSNRPEWLQISLGINNAGFVDVPRGENSTAEELNYILRHSRARILIVENSQLLDKIDASSLENVDRVFSIRPIDEVDGWQSLICGKTSNSSTGKAEKAEKAEKNGDFPKLEEDCMASIIYTSGTTSLPKGVVLSHGNLMSNVSAVLRRITLTTEDKLLSILPAWHAFERIAKYIALASGANTFYTNSMNLRKDLAEQQPTAMVSVPRIWEMVYNGVAKKIRESKTIQRKIVIWGLRGAVDFCRRRKFDPLRLVQMPLYWFMDRNVFSKIREGFGGKLRLVVSGGSSLPAYIDDFFRAIGMELIEGYGLTETSPVISARVPGKPSLYTVGPVLEGIEARIMDKETGREADPGETGVLLVKGPGVMKGYYRNFSETKRVLYNDGWFNTGDLACFDKTGNLRIMGREKDVIVLLNGENVNPIPFEIALSQSEFINSAVVVGQDWKQLGALILPDMEALLHFCRGVGMDVDGRKLYSTFDSVEVQELFRDEINRLVNNVSWCKVYEKIKKFSLITEPFEVGRELTPTLKPKRAVIEHIHHLNIEHLRKAINGPEEK